MNFKDLDEFHDLALFTFQGHNSVGDGTGNSRSAKCFLKDREQNLTSALFWTGFYYGRYVVDGNKVSETEAWIDDLGKPATLEKGLLGQPADQLEHCAMVIGKKHMEPRGCSSTSTCGICLLELGTVFTLRGLCREATVDDFDVFYIQNGHKNDK